MICGWNPDTEIGRSVNKKGIKIMRKVLREGTWIRLSQGELYKNYRNALSEKAAEVSYTRVKKYLILMGKLQSVKLTMR